MICPACKTDMIVVEHGNIELDYCINCHGVWFDSGELELLLKSMNLESRDTFLDSVLDSPETASLEKKLKCPLCHQKMKKTSVGPQPEILVDVCREGDGLWFDGGEVAELIRQLVTKLPGEQGSQQQVISFLGEVFKA